MQHKYEVRFAKSDPETPPTMDEHVAIARQAARKLGVPNAESTPTHSRRQELPTGEVWTYVEWTWQGLR